MNNRLIYADVLRVAATFSVILLHVAAGGWSYAGVGSFEWNVFNFYDGLVRFGVPIFVMISGIFFLDPNKNVSCRDIYGKYIFRIVKAFIAWSLLYAIYTSINNYDTFDYDVFIKSFVLGHYHLWYLFMIVGLYIITPLLRKIAEDKEAAGYFLLLSFIFVFILPMVVKIFNFKYLEMIIKKFDFHFVIGYAGYYVGGFYLNTNDIKKERRNAIYILGVLSIIGTIVFTRFSSINAGQADGTFYSYFSPNVMIASIAVFIFFKYEVSKIKFGEKSLAAIKILTAYSFRIYLIHDFFNIFFSNMGIDAVSFNPVLSVPITAILVYSASLAASFIIGRIPVLRKIL
ncbi:MAG TPA: hypothetical protein DCM73_04170 [Clostridiales bacterium]|nr:hypothetical protein [Clostridiales bacterium]